MQMQEAQPARLPVTTYHLSAVTVDRLYRPRQTQLHDGSALALCDAITGGARFAHLRWLQHISGAKRA